MHVKNYKLSKSEQIYEILDKNGYILDDESMKILGVDNLYRIHEYVRIWKRLNSDREFFKDKKILEKKKGHRSHVVKTQCSGDSWYKVGREFFNEIKL